MTCPECDDDNWICADCGAGDCDNCGDIPRQADGEVYCYACFDEFLDTPETVEMIEEVVNSLVITGEVEVYDPQYHYAPSRAEYEAGQREAYTPNSVDARNRHRATNYDEILKTLDKDDDLDKVIYDRLRDRLDDLLYQNAATSRQPQPQPKVAVLTCIAGGAT